MTHLKKKKFVKVTFQCKSPFNPRSITVADIHGEQRELKGKVPCLLSVIGFSSKLVFNLAVIWTQDLSVWKQVLSTLS